MGPDELRRQAALEDRHFWYAARRRQVARRLGAEAGRGWALDLGAGSGGNTSLLTDAGYHAVALERHPVAAQVARSRGLAVLEGDGHRLPFADATFDLVLACDVLEHLDDDLAAVQEVRRVLRPGGRLLLTVPADPTLWSAHDVALDHRRRYTRQTLSAVLEEGGLHLSAMSAWMVLLRPLVALRRRVRAHSSEEGSKEVPASDLEEVAPLVNRLLAGVLRLEDRLPALGARRGVSLIAVAVKRVP